MHKVMSSYVQTNLTDKSGLPLNSVNSIAQTIDGYLWFGNEEGLSRYDGTRITVFDTLKYKSLRDNDVNSMASGRDGSLWVGTRTGLTRFKDGGFRTYIAAQSPINTIYEDRDGAMWVGGMNGLYEIKAESIRLYSVHDGLPNTNVTSIVQGQDGTLWLGTGKGVVSLKRGSFHPYGDRDGLPTDFVISLATSHDGSLWVATASGLFRWKDRLLSRILPSALPPHARITSLLEDRTGVLWMTFDHSGIATLRNGEVVRYTARMGLPADDATKLFEDRDGHIWVGLFEGGVVEFREGIFSSFGRREGLSDDMVWSVLEARDGSTWVGTNSRGLNHIEKSGRVRDYTSRDGLPSGSIYALFEGADNSLWAGAEDGALAHIQGNRITVFRDPASKGSRVASILQGSGGDLLLGFHEVNGLVRFHAGSFLHSSVPGLVNTLTAAPDGSIWAGSDHGGVSHIVDGVVTANYTSQNGLLSDFAQAVYVDRDGVVWAGTSPGGLNRIKNGHVTTYSIDQGLFNQTVGAIREDDYGYLWMTCNKGIYKVSKKELNDYADGRISVIHSVVYGTADGLRNVECNFAADPSVWKGSNGRLWFATSAGIASIDPGRSQVIVSEPFPSIERVLVNQQPVLFRQGVKVGPGDADLEIDFTAPVFDSPERVRFRYRLNGIDADWVNVGNRRQAYYTKLPPGHYLFEVQGANADVHGVNGQLDWDPHVARIDIKLSPRFWQAQWFRVLCGLIASLCGIGLYRLRVRFLVSHNRELEERVHRRTFELQQATKLAEEAQRALYEQATKDSLTKLWNRHTIFEILHSEAARAQREGSPLCILMVDVDHFKHVNDTYGHVIGDRVLQEIANRISGMTRNYDSAGRYGGEEFVVILPGCSIVDGMQRAEQFRSVIAEAPICTGAGSLYITCSFGVASPACVTNIEALIHQADQALYLAKSAGRNCIYAN